MKPTGKGTFVEPGVPAMEWLDPMRGALSMNQFSVVYQPFIRMATERVVGIEALARWTDPEKGEIEPAHFIPLAEENGVILEFTEWMIARAIDEIALLSSQHRDLLLIVNVSPHVLCLSSFSQFLEQTVEVASRHNLIIEIAENFRLPEEREAAFRNAAMELMEKGFRFALDDFGTGLLDLRQMILFPAHILKTNISLIRHSGKGHRGNLVMSLVAEVARELRMQVIAEGVENAEEWQKVKTFGFEYAKGYLFCPPLPLKSLDSWLELSLSGKIPLHAETDELSNGMVFDRPEVPPSEIPVLILDEEDSEWLIELQNRSKKRFIRGKIESGVGMLNRFDFLACIMGVGLVSTKQISFLQQCRRFYPDMPVIVVANELEVSGMVRLMREGVTDFILQPGASREAVRRILSHIKNREAMIRSTHMSERMVRQLRSRIEWESYKENRNISTDNRFGQKTIDHLRISLTQGSGVGILISLLEMLNQQKPLKDGSRIISAELMKMTMNNVYVAQKHLDGIESIVDLMKKELILKKVCSHDFINLTMEILSEISSFFQKKSIKLNLPIWKERENFSIEVEIDYFRLALRELAVNAYKYALPNTEIDLIATVRAGYVCLGIKNIVSHAPWGGIPDELAESVTEPFYRLHPPVEDAIEIETFGLGLGLTAVKFIMHKHRGMLSLKEVRDHSQDKVRPAVLASIFFPVEKTVCESD